MDPSGIAAPLAPLSIDLGGLDPEVAEIVGGAREHLLSDPEDGARWGRLGLAFEANYRFEEALACYREATRLAPKEAKWHFRKGIVHERRGETDEAIAAHRAAIREVRAYAPAHWHLGFQELERGELDRARSAFRRATRLDPEGVAGWVGAARVELQADAPEAAIDILRRVLEEHPDEDYARNLLATAYRQAGRWDEVADELGDLPQGEARWPDPMSMELLNYRRSTAIAREERAVRLAQEGDDLEGSIQLLEELVEENPDDAGQRSSLGNAYVRAGRLDEACAAYEAVLRLEPESREALVDLAIVATSQGEHEEALGLIDRALDVHPGFGRAHEVRGDALRASGASAGALAAYRRARELDARDPNLAVKIGLLLVKLSHWVEAEEVLEEALAQGASGVEPHLALARSLLQQGRLDEARAALESAGTIPPRLAPLAERLRGDLERRAAGARGSVSRDGAEGGGA